MQEEHVSTTVYLLLLHQAQPCRVPPHTGPSSYGIKPATYSCPYRQVDSGAISQVLGSFVTHVEFVPRSDSHFALLLNGVQFHVYATSDPTAPE